MERPKQPKTSRLAYEKIMMPEVKEGTYKKILMALEVIKDGTAWEIAAHLGMKPDKIWKRCSELRRDEVIFDTNISRFSPDGNFAMVYAISSRKSEYKHLISPERHYMEGQTTTADFTNLLTDKTTPKPEKITVFELPDDKPTIKQAELF